LDRYRAGGIYAHAVEETIHKYDRAAQEVWKAAGLAASSKIEVVVMTLAQLAENGADTGLVGARPLSENPLASPERFKRRPDG
jgi:hypothetical protein